MLVLVLHDHWFCALSSNLPGSEVGVSRRCFHRWDVRGFSLHVLQVGYTAHHCCVSAICAASGWTWRGTDVRIGASSRLFATLPAVRIRFWVSFLNRYTHSIFWKVPSVWMEGTVWPVAVGADKLRLNPPAEKPCGRKTRSPKLVNHTKEPWWADPHHRCLLGTRLLL